jgi:hypothetical protein
MLLKFIETCSKFIEIDLLLFVNAAMSAFTYSKHAYTAAMSVYINANDARWISELSNTISDQDNCISNGAVSNSNESYIKTINSNGQ